MRTRPAFLSTLIAAPLLLGAIAAQADAPPQLNVAATCRSSGAANPDEDKAAGGCLRSENEAHGTLKQQWANFGPDAKRQCSQQSRAGGFPSYVELLTCLELATGSVNIQPGREPTATGSLRGQRRDMPSTDAGNVRIDPQRVLDQSLKSED